MPLRATMPKTVRKPTNEPSEMTPPPKKYADSTPPTRAIGQGEEGQGRQPPAPVGRLQQQEDHQRRGAGGPQQACRGSLPLGVLAQHLGPELQRPADGGECRLDVRDHRAQVPRAVDVRADVDAPEQVVMVDHVRDRDDADLGQLVEPHPTPRRGVDQEVRADRSRSPGPRVGSTAARRRRGRPGRCRRPPRPPTIQAAARRTSPGFTPYRRAAARSTSTLTWGTLSWNSTWFSMTPGMLPSSSLTSVAFSRSRSRS